MNIALGLALYFVIWWMTLFAVLPFGVHTQAENGVVIPGTPESAPARPRFKRIVAINTIVASLVFAVVVIAMYYDVLGIGAMATRPPETTR
jgi:predicted secreted protein